MSTTALAQRVQRSVAAACSATRSGRAAGRGGSCTAIRNTLSAAIGHLEAGRRNPATNDLATVRRLADQAHRAGELSDADVVIISGGVDLLQARVSAP